MIVNSWELIVLMDLVIGTLDNVLALRMLLVYDVICAHPIIGRSLVAKVVNLAVVIQLVHWIISVTEYVNFEEQFKNKTNYIFVILV